MNFEGLNVDFVNWFKSLYGDDVLSVDYDTLNKMHLAFLSGQARGRDRGYHAGYNDGYHEAIDCCKRNLAHTEYLPM